MVSKYNRERVKALTRLKRGLNSDKQHPRFLTKIEEIREMYAIEARLYYSRKEANRLGWYDFEIPDRANIGAGEG